MNEGAAGDGDEVSSDGFGVAGWAGLAEGALADSTGTVRSEGGAVVGGVSADAQDVSAVSTTMAANANLFGSRFIVQPGMSLQVGKPSGVNGLVTMLAQSESVCTVR